MNIKDPIDKKKRIIDAAIKLFSEKGYHGATTALIAKEAGVSQGIIFHHFKNKEDLFFSLLKEKCNLFMVEFRKRVGNEQNALKKIEIAVLIYVQLVRKEKKFFEMLIMQTTGSGLDLEKINKYGMMEAFRIIGEIVKEGIQQGVIRKINPEVAATCIFGMLDYNVMNWLLFGKNFALEDTSKQVVDIFLRGIAKTTI